MSIYDFDTSWQTVLEYIIKIGIAYLLALPVAFNREQSARSAGLRTFPLVAVGSCAYMLIALAMLQTDEAQGRVLHGIATGIGFIGGGAILKSRGSVHGTATAASIWNTGALGVAVAFGRLEIAIILSMFNLFTLYFFKPLKKRFDHDDEDENDEERDHERTPHDGVSAGEAEDK